VILKIFKSGCALILVLILAACSSHTKPTEDLGEMSRDDFMNAMRWKRYNVAAGLMQPEYAEDFLKTFRALKDIHIVDVRLIDVKRSAEGYHFETTMEMDYYLLPSVTVKTYSFDQSWQFFGEESSKEQAFFIVSPFPDFP
jgi:hypothetical protein